MSKRAIVLSASILVLLVLPCVGCGGGSGGGGPPPTPIGPQIVVGDVDILAGTVTITTPASHLAVTGTSTDDGGGNATVTLTVLNNFTRLLFNLKAIVTAVTDGVAAGDGLYQGDPYAYFGPEALAPAAMDTASFTLSGLGGTTFSFTAELVNHKMLVLQNDGPSSTPVLVDSSGTGEETNLDHDTTVAYLADSNHPGVLFSPDGRFLYFANGNQPALAVVDTTTLLPVLTTDLTGAANLQMDGTGSVGMTHGLVASPGATFLYTAYTEGAHKFSSDSIGPGSGDVNGAIGVTSTTYLVKIDRATLAEVSRVMLHTAPTGVAAQSGKGLSISSDGARAAIAIQNAGLVYVVDTPTMTIFDADLITPGAQGFDVSAHSPDPRHTAFGPGNVELFVAHSKDDDGAGNRGDLDRINLATRMVGLLPLSAAFNANTYNECGSLRLGPDGRLYYTHPFDSTLPGLTIYDFGAAAWTDLHAPPSYLGLSEILFPPGGTSYWVQDTEGSNEVYQFQIGTNAVIPTEADGTNSFSGPGGNIHCAACSPF
ncbi:MAG: YncE family protein [Planctomycetota bacterium]|jgi:hypothetical protein